MLTILYAVAGNSCLVLVVYDLLYTNAIEVSFDYSVNLKPINIPF